MAVNGHGCIRGEWCGQCYSNRRCRSVYSHHRYRGSVRRTLEVDMSRFVSRGGSVPSGSGSEFDGSLDPWLKELEALCEYLSLSKWEDGKPRETATISISVDDGRLKGCLNDRANQRSAWFSGATLGALLCNMDESLRTGEVGWRRNQWGKGRK